MSRWKSFDESKLYIDPLTIIIGANASGKSNILDALLLLQKLSEGVQITTAFTGNSTEKNGIRGGVNWMIRTGEKSCRLAVTIKSDEDELLEYYYQIELGLIEGRVELVSELLSKVKLRKTNDNKVYSKLFYTDNDDISNPSITTYYSTNTQGRGKKFEMRRSYSILSQSRSMSLLKDVQKGVELVSECLKKIFVFDPIPSAMRDYTSYSDKLNRDGSNISGVLAALPSPEKEDVEVKLTRFLKLIPEKDIIRVYTEPIGKFGTDAMLYVEEHWNNQSIPMDAKGLSDGTLRFIAIMTALLTIKKGSLLVIEEIDNGLHPARSNVLVNFIIEIGLSRGIDVICTTHNPTLLDAFGNEMIPFISLVHRNDTTGASEITLLEDLKELPRLLGSGKVGTIMSRGLLEDVA